MDPSKHWSLDEMREPRFEVAIVKVASRCNLNCSYCYMYNLGDDSYLAQPGVMSRATVDALLRNVGAHCARHGAEHFRFVFHGGEPLLAGPEFFRYFVEQAARALPTGTQPLFGMQTNGTLLSRPWCELLSQLGVSLGISVDGPRALNDVRRVDHAGKGSYERIRRGWDLAVASGLRPGLLTVIDLAADPLEIFRHVLELDPRKVDFLFPDASHEQPSAVGTPYADWLLRIFEVWIGAETPPVRIRLFEHIVAAVLGLQPASDALGPGENRIVVIETDGGIEPVDVLKVCGNGITKTPLNVAANELDEAFGIPLIDLYYHSGARLCATCEGCAVKGVCAGGYLPHRYRNANGFDNPSVYCRDLMKLIVTIQNWVVTTLPADIVASANVVPLRLDAVLRAGRGAEIA